jgi:glucose-1-phosphate cytidylyltransferase
MGPVKVVLFCGGLGLRLRDYSQSIPKPMIRIGAMPLLWQVMKYFAHYGHKDFILCLGYNGDVIKKFFLEYNEALANDFVISNGGSEVKLANEDIADWTITCVDTGLDANIGMRLMRVREHLAGEEMFLANYSDGLTDLPFDRYMDFAREQDKVASFVSVRPTASFHNVEAERNGRVTSIQPASETSWINCGYFALKQEIFDYMEDGDELVVEPFQRLIDKGELVTWQHEGFWECADTFKDKMLLDAMVERGETPWMVWK